MAKRNRTITTTTNNKRSNQKRGFGRLADYQPWLQIQDVATQSVVSRVKGWKTGRIHHLLSQLELNYFYTLEWAAPVIDIREQFPLDLDETLAIAESLGVKHPSDRVTSENIVMTTTFSVTVRGGVGTREFARTVINSKLLNNAGALKKLEIERRYWVFRRIDWGIVTEQDLNDSFVRNIGWVHPFLEADTLAPMSPEDIDKTRAFIIPALEDVERPLREITNQCDEKLGLPAGGALSIVRHLIAARILNVDMNVSIQPSYPLKLIK